MYSYYPEQLSRVKENRWVPMRITGGLRQQQVEGGVRLGSVLKSIAEGQHIVTVRDNRDSRVATHTVTNVRLRSGRICWYCS